LLDEVLIHLIPLLLGSGVRPLDHRALTRVAES